MADADHAAAHSTAALHVLASSALFPRIVAFQDGLPGLLRALKRDVRPYKDDLAALAVRRGSGSGRIHALEMIDGFRRQPEYVERQDLSYNAAAVVAAELGDVRALRWMFDRTNAAHRPTDAAGLWTKAVTHFKAGDFSVVELLADHIPSKTICALPKECWRHLGDAGLLQWIHYRFAVTLPRSVFLEAVGRGDHGFVDFWLAKRRERPPAEVLTKALMKDHWTLFLLLVTDTSLDGDEDERRRLAVDAVRQKDLAMLKLLHAKPFKTPPVEALELAAEKGFLEFVEELCYLHKESILTTKALCSAAANGHLEIVRLIHKRSKLAGVPEAIDGAASGGHLSVVRFLHAHKLFTATHKAMDGAAANGHLTVLQFLNENRKEGCTPDALAQAAANGHEAVVGWLIEKRPEVRCSRGLDGLLVHGRVADWLVYREEWSLVDSKYVDSEHNLGLLMFEAGEQGKLKAVRFLIDVMHGAELLYRAVEGAAKIGSVGWLCVLRSVCPHAVLRGRLSLAVYRAFQAFDEYENFQPSDEERVDSIKWLLLQSGDRTDTVFSMAMGLAAERAESHDRYRVQESCRELLLWMDTRGDDDAAELERFEQQYVTDAFRFAAFGSACDWAVECGVSYARTHSRKLHGDCWPFGQHDEDDKKWLLGNKTWPKRAIERGDMAVLHYCHEITSSVALQDDEIDSFSFDESVLRAAIASGNLAIVMWCVSTGHDGQLDDPGLLASAINYAQPQVADWLLAKYPQCCAEPSVTRFDVWWKSVGPPRFDVWESCASPAILDWLDRLDASYPQLVRYLQPAYIAYSLAHGGHVVLLERWIQSHPEVLDNISDILFHAAVGKQLEAAQFVCDVISRCQRGNAAPYGMNGVDEHQIQQAMATAASRDCLPIVDLLFAQFPSIPWHTAVRDAAIYASVSVLRFFFVNGYDDWARDEHMREPPKMWLVRRLAFLCCARGARSL